MYYDINSAIFMTNFCALFLAISVLKLSHICQVVQNNFCDSLTDIINNKQVFLWRNIRA